MDGSFRGARWAWTWKPEGSRFPSSLLEWWSQLRPRQRWNWEGWVGETLFQRGLGVCICSLPCFGTLVLCWAMFVWAWACWLGDHVLSWVFFFPQWGLGVCVVLWSVGCKSIQFLVHSIGACAGVGSGSSFAVGAIGMTRHPAFGTTKTVFSSLQHWRKSNTISCSFIHLAAPPPTGPSPPPAPCTPFPG